MSADPQSGVEVVGDQDLIIPACRCRTASPRIPGSFPTGFVSYGSYSTGMWVPYVPQWRDTILATYTPNEKLAFSAAARIQGKMYSTLDNSDYVPNVQGAFDSFAIVDAHVRYQLTDNVSADVGIDNIFNDKYFLFHPFPGRTYLASLKVKL